VWKAERRSELTQDGPCWEPERRDWLILGLLSLSFALFFQLGVPLRASFGARITADEPFYLLTTESLLVDRDLDLTNQYAQQSYWRFFDHEDPLWYQSVPARSGAILSPHNAGLSVLVLPAYALGGLDGAKGFLGALAGLTLGWTYLLTQRVTGLRGASAVAVVLLGFAAPWFIYATQIYPEAPAGLLVVVLVWWLLGPRHRSWVGILPAGLLVALLWLGSKYAPLAAVLAMLTLVRLDRSARLWFLVALGGLGLHYAILHLWIYGGLTPYAVNTLYAGSSTVELVGAHFELGNRLYRLLGLWVDREFGLLRWAPALALAAPGIWLLGSRPGPARWLVLLPFGVVFLVATFLTITMRGWWFPGRMLIVGLPLLAPLMALTIQRLAERRVGLVCLLGLALATLETTLRLWQSARAGQVTLAVNPFEIPGIWLNGTASIFPLYTEYGLDTLLLSVLWTVLLVGAVLSPALVRSRWGLRRSMDSGQPAGAAP
jgi:hypothetical protein